jgi:hypothetical protein
MNLFLSGEGMRFIKLLGIIGLIGMICSFFIMTRPLHIPQILGKDEEKIYNIQDSPKITLRPRRGKEREIGANKIDIKLKLKVSYPNEKKSIPYYEAFFVGRYNIENQGERAALLFEFPLPKTYRTFSNIQLLVNGREPRGVEYRDEGISFSMDLKRGESKEIVVKYKAAGENNYIYSLDHMRRIEDFGCVMDLVGVEEVEFPKGCLSPTNKIKTKSGWHILWNFKNLLTRYNIGIDLPQAIEKGRFELLGLSAPIFLLLFLGCLKLSSRIDYVSLESHHYLAVGILFFLFYPLMVILSKHLPISWSFGIAFVVICGFVLNFLRHISSLEFAIKRGFVLLAVFLLLCSLATLMKEERNLLLILSALIIVASLTKVFLGGREVVGEKEVLTNEDPKEGLIGLLGDLRKEEGLEKEDLKPNRGFCPYCGEEVLEGYEFCPSCGKGTPKFARCKECGKEFYGEEDIQYKYCPECGNAIKRS